ncbi:GEVED domain-containing protein [Taibaiella soli]|uniref:Uncharacterized protein n=1 Tax=Taibaiella soli TaxID=1649169 RepID=A0A2W2BFZ8_9BACT|nr:GEVED domain-containing protein [Taibaiella soli]PZF74837.1 hypothetical protein DN068_01170 [Taibaiella soli]
MKKTILLFTLLWTFNVQAQTNYSFPIYSIINSMPNGMRLPNGTIVRAATIATGTGAHDAVSGTAGSTTNMGGTFSGTTMTGYVGNTTPTTFTVIETANTNTIAGGTGNNCANSIGFRVYFDRPTLDISFLALDCDGFNTNPGNAEWVSSMAFNADAFVPYTQTTSAGTLLVTQSITTNNTWRTLATNTISATAATNIPTTLSIQRATGGGANPNDIVNQVLFNPTDPNAPVTNFFGLWGLWQTPAGINNQTSGFSPIVVTVSPDFGDDPDSYKTLLASGGPSHDVVGTLALGILNSPKADGQPSALANLDPDDDGLSTVPLVVNTNLLTQTISNYTLTTSFTNNTGLAANYVAWIDWNNNGTFEASEAQTATSPAATTTGTVTFTWANATLSGASGVGNTYARIRVTTEAITTSDVGGAFKDGEVEDYALPFVVPLPLELINFRGNLQNGRAQLAWETANEKNTDHFDVEYSNNGHDFEKISEVKAMGNGGHNYQYVDERMTRNRNYYRLKMVDADGTGTYSKIVSIIATEGKTFTISASPNPVDNVMNLAIRSDDGLYLQVYNTLGREVYSEVLTSPENAHLDCSRLTPGNYYLKATNSFGESKTITFIKK